MAEQQPRRPQRAEPRQRFERRVHLEVRRGSGGPQVAGVRDGDADRVPDVKVAGAGADQADVVTGVPGE